ncbi:MAG: phospholipase [Actinomycetota bacterium]|nr:phospholipase [Actinomycetota bacterium]
MSLTTRILTVVAAVAALSTSATTANAMDVRADADRIMNLTYVDFANHPRVAPFDWSTDGCTGIGESFAPACVQHDFGYRNYGNQGALKLSPTEETRAWLDERFWHEMRRLCFDTHGPSGGATNGCLGAARVVYDGVRAFGGSSFF